MIARVALLAVLFGLAACQKAAEPPAAKVVDERHFGAPFSIPGRPTQVAEILKEPEKSLGQKVKCTGTVAQVCQAMGCWLELRAVNEGPGLRVPMAGHAFFVPKDIVGRSAVVEGVLEKQALSAGQLAHLQGEGLTATGPLFLEATSVLVR